MERLRGSITYSNVVATLALLLAMAGGAYAAGLGKDSVRSKNIKDGQVKSKDVRDNGLKGSDIAESSLGTVPNAAVADRAGDADTLDGVDSGALVRYFAGSIDDTLPNPVFTVPEMNLQLAGDTSPVSTSCYRVRNTGSSGLIAVSDLADQTGQLFSVNFGATSSDRCDTGPLVAVNTAHPELMLVFGCAENSRAYCYGELMNAPSR